MVQTTAVRRSDAAPETSVALGELDSAVGFHLRIAQTLSFQSFAQIAGESNLSPGHFATLTIIGANPGITQTALSRANGRDKSSLTPVLDDLTRRGLVRRRRARDNRRAYALELTDEGDFVRGRLLAAAERHEQRIKDILGGPDYASLVALLKRVEGGLATDRD